MTFEHKTVSQIITTTLSDNEKKYKKVGAVIRNGEVIRREHYRNYKRSVKGGLSTVDRIAMNITRSNLLFARFMKERIYK
jgi:hypothetical protein